MTHRRFIVKIPLCFASFFCRCSFGERNSLKITSCLADVVTIKSSWMKSLVRLLDLIALSIRRLFFNVSLKHGVRYIGQPVPEPPTDSEFMHLLRISELFRFM